MTLCEMATAAVNKQPVKVLVIDNKYLGMVRQWQELFYTRRYAGVTLSQENRPENEKIVERPGYLPDFIKLADAHGANARRVSKAEEVAPALAEAFASRKPWVIECIVSEEANVFPMIPPGMQVSDMINRTV